MIDNIFLQTNKNLPWLKDNTVLLTRHGSIAYGTNTPESDEDFKGVCIPTKKYYLGAVNKFEQCSLKEPDTVIYELNKFIELASQCNPNIIEVLFTDPKDHIIVTDAGKVLLDNKEKFLSKRIKFTFSGYAVSQLKRIKLHRKWLLSPVTVEPKRSDFGLPEKTLIPQDQLMAVNAEIQKELDKFNFDFMSNLDEASKIEIKSIITDMLSEMKIYADEQWSAMARKVGMDENFILLMAKEREYNARRKEYENYQNWKINRNTKRAELEAKYGYDCKHAYNLVRLMRMCAEILSTGEVIVKRPDYKELLEIRNGAWSYDYLIKWAEDKEKEINELYSSSKLPHTPDRNYLDNLCIELVEKNIYKK